MRPTAKPGTPLLVLLLAAWALPTVAAAQADTPLDPLPALPAGAAAAALGGAYPLGDAGPAAIFANPGALAGAKSGAEATYGRWASGDDGAATLGSVAGAAEWWHGEAAVALRTVGCVCAGGVGSVGEPALFGAGAGAGAPLSLTEIGAAYARRFGRLRVGVGGRLRTARLDGRRDENAGFDVGATLPLGPLLFGATVRGLGPDLEPAGETVGAGTTVEGQAALQSRPLGPLDVSAAVRVLDQDGHAQAGAGLQVGWWPVLGRTFIARVGYAARDLGDDGPTFGLAFHGDAIRIAWSYDRWSRTSVQRVSLGWTH